MLGSSWWTHASYVSTIASVDRPLNAGCVARYVRYIVMDKTSSRAARPAAPAQVCPVHRYSPGPANRVDSRPLPGSSIAQVCPVHRYSLAPTAQPAPGRSGRSVESVGGSAPASGQVCPKRRVQTDQEWNRFRGGCWQVAEHSQVQACQGGRIVPTEANSRGLWIVGRVAGGGGMGREGPWRCAGATLTNRPGDPSSRSKETLRNDPGRFQDRGARPPSGRVDAIVWEVCAECFEETVAK